MKKILFCLFFIFSMFTVFACDNSNTDNSVKDVVVTEYQDTVETGDMYDEESVYINVTFTSGKTKIYCGNDLTFDYSEFDSSEEGFYMVYIKINELNYTTSIEVEVIKKRFNVLMISNSYGDDTIQWVHEIANSLGVEFKIANLYIGGCVLQTHLNNLKTDSKAYQYVVYNSNSKSWSRKANTSISEALLDEDWNYVALQQGSSQSGLPSTYDLIDDVMDEVLEIKEDVKFIWNMTWAYQQDIPHGSFGSYQNDQMTMYNAIVNSVQTKVVPNERFVKIIPNGTAVQNARTSYIGDNLCRDEHCHLTNDLGRYIAGLTMVAALTGMDISNISYSPALSPEYKQIAIESVINALNNPFEITNSQYKTEKPNPNTTVTNIEVTKYQDKVEVGADFDESSVSVSVTYSDGKKIICSGDDLSFDYSEFDSSVEGSKMITVKINDLNLTTKINVEVVDEFFKVIMIANSYGDDTVKWVHEIAENLGIEFKIANLYIGGCTLSTHLDNLENNKKAYEYVVYDSVSKQWSRQANTSIKEALESEDWNYVSLQQGSHQSGLADTYDIINQVMDKVLEIKDDVKFIWNMTWAYQQNSGHSNFGNYQNDQMIMYNAILNAVQTKVVPNNRFVAIVPNGTAIQNARTSYIGDNLCRDPYCHLTNDLGRFIAGLTMVGKLTGADLTKVTYSPGLSEQDRKLAIESAVNAINNPFTITNSKHTEEEQLDLTNYVEIDCELVGSAYWNSADPYDLFNKYITNANNSMNFVATKRFTRETLPVGSIIMIGEGYQYRPEAWLSDTNQTSRPENVSTKYVSVTEAWWGNYSYRAFNISAKNGSSLEFSMKQAMDAFKIYVPKDKYVAPSGNPYASGDGSLFSSKGLDIKNYSMYDYYFSNGFYNSGSDSIILKINYFDKSGTFCHQYICTEAFTKENLPVGSVIIVDSGYQYRPDGWISAATNPNRPVNVTTRIVVVDDAWWGNYTVRGFNISSTTSGTPINQIPYEATAHVRIYVPNN